jgi:hypothetical protein
MEGKPPVITVFLLSLPFFAELKICELFMSTPYFLIAWCLVR